jgi:hypothetical protein
MSTAFDVLNPDEATLADLAETVRTEHAAVETAMRSSVEHALIGGRALIVARSLLPHGAWLPWLRERCEIKERTAQLYMQLARHRDELEQLLADKSATIADLKLNEAVALLVSEEIVLEDKTASCANQSGSSATTTPTPAVPVPAAVQRNVQAGGVATPETGNLKPEQAWLKDLAPDDLMTWLKELWDGEDIDKLAQRLPSFINALRAFESEPLDLLPFIRGWTPEALRALTTGIEDFLSSAA